MNRIIKTVVLIFLVQKLSTAEAFMDETCEVNREMEQQCRSYTYSVVKPMLDYLRQVSEELQESKSKDEIIKDLREKLVQQEIYEALIKELRSQIDLQKRIDSLLTESYGKYKDELASKSVELDRLNVKMKKLNAKDLVDKSKKFEICEVQLRNLNNSLIEKDKSISRYNAEMQNVTEYKKTVEWQFKESQAKLLKIEKDNQLCEEENDKLNRTLLNNIPLDCSPFESNPGIHTINLPGFGLSDVRCSNMPIFNGSWLVILYRVFGGEENFNRDWATYREGFGSLDSEFFLGLEKIHRLTSSRSHEAYMFLTETSGNTCFTRYNDFKISDENSGYALNCNLIEEWPRQTICSIRLHEGTKFTTYDRDNDQHKNNCASLNKYGWWYNDCDLCRGLRGFRSHSICGDELKILTVMIRPI